MTSTYSFLREGSGFKSKNCPNCPGSSLRDGIGLIIVSSGGEWCPFTERPWLRRHSFGRGVLGGLTNFRILTGKLFGMRPSTAIWEHTRPGVQLRRAHLARALTGTPTLRSPRNTTVRDLTVAHGPMKPPPVVRRPMPRPDSGPEIPVRRPRCQGWCPIVRESGERKHHA